MKPILVLHAGAIFDESDYDPKRDQEYKDVLNKALEAGYAVLNAGKSALDSVEIAIQLLEDSGMFDAGRGAVYSSDGTQAHDASIMDGSNLKAGAVAGVNKIKHPISAARKVMENTKHVLLIGEGAIEFAATTGIEMVERSYFHNEMKYQRYLKLKENEQKLHGTVGAVALDKMGNLAAGTSTGGMEMKHYGRVGDSPIIGAATYADNKTCAISCTGQGEYFIRTSAAYDVVARMKYGKQSLQEASQSIVDTISDMGARGGLIGLTTTGEIVMPYTTDSMFRAYKTPDKTFVAITEKA